MQLLRKLYTHLFKRRLQSTTTVKYMFPAVLGTLATLSVLALSGSSVSSYAFLEAPARAYETGEVFPVTILASAAVPVNAVDLEVSFPSDKLEVFSVDRGQSVITVWTEEPVVENTFVKLTGGTFRRGFIGEHEIATINFRAVETGQYTIALQEVAFVAGDGEGTAVDTTDNAASSLALFTFDENTNIEDIQVAIQTEISTDTNDDGEVTLQDISAFMGAWSNKSRLFDFNGDGKMSFRDFSIILADFFTE